MGVAVARARAGAEGQRQAQGAGLLRGGPRGGGAQLHCFVTDESPRFAVLASRFLGMSIQQPRWVSPADLYGLELAHPREARRAIAS